MGIRQTTNFISHLTISKTIKLKQKIGYIDKLSPCQSIPISVVYLLENGHRYKHFSLASDMQVHSLEKVSFS